jgi:WD40 repeat protein
LLASHSFDSVNVWQIDFSANQKSLNVNFKAHIDSVVNVLSLLILPGNKYIVMGTKEGDLHMYDLNEGQVCQTIDQAHKKEIWELAMHTSP